MKVIHDATRNTVVQVTGRAPLAWTTVVDMEKLNPRPREVRLDSVYYAVGQDAEVQFAWAGEKDRMPFLPLGGRGKVDFGEVTGVHNTLDGRTGHMEMAAFGEGIFTIILDLSKHQGV